MVGSGPFILTDAVKGQYYRYETNPTTGADAPNIDGIEFKIYQNDNGLVTALQNGEIDFADDIDANLFDTLEGAREHHREVVAVLRLQLHHLQRWRPADRRHADPANRPPVVEGPGGPRGDPLRDRQGSAGRPHAGGTRFAG